MSSEITLSIAVRVQKGYLYFNFNPGQSSHDLATARRGGHIQTIGVAEEDLDLGDVVAPGLCILRNLDTANFVTVGPKVGTTDLMEPMLQLRAGQIAILWLDPAVTLTAVATGGSVNLQVDVFEV